MRKRFLGTLTAGMFLGMSLALSAASQVAGSRAKPVTIGNRAQAARLPYTAEYKIFNVKTLANGATLTHEYTDFLDEVVLVEARPLAGKDYHQNSGGDAMPMKNPPHPGDFIKTEIVEAYGLSVTAAATALGVSRPALSSLLNGKAGLSGEMALRIEKAFGVRMDTLMRMQSSYEIAQTRKREKLIRVRRVVCAV